MTHPLLACACDEFVYLESILDAQDEIHKSTGTSYEAARNLLEKALRLHVQRGELPVPASELKATMQLLDPTFNEVNFGYTQFRAWLETYSESVSLYLNDMQLFVTPKDSNAPVVSGMQPVRSMPVQNGHANERTDLEPNLLSFDPALSKPSLRVQYKQIFNRLKMTSVDFSTRRDVLRDIYRELSAWPGERTTDELLEELCTRYETQGLIRSKTTLRQIWQMGFRQRGFDYRGKVASVHVPVWLADEIDSEAAFIHRAESGFVYAVVNAGLDIDATELAAILLNDPEQEEYIASLLDDLAERRLIAAGNGRYVLPGPGAIPLQEDPLFDTVIHDISHMQLPDNLPRTIDKARALAKTAMLQRSQDFAASARSYLCACRLQWDAVEAGVPGATLEDLRWYIASYASVKAGEMSQIHRNYRGSRPYYLAFFSLVQEDDPLWSRMRGLINPMLSYFWVNAWRELGLSMGNPSTGTSSPAEIAVAAATNEHQELCELWFDMTSKLAEVNPGLLRRVVSQIRLNRADVPVNGQVADQLEQMLMA